jgi:diguanylate cyclase (GGDEF)-like protein
MALKYKLFILLITPIVVLCGFHILELQHVTTSFEATLSSHKERATEIVVQNLGNAINTLNQIAVSLSYPKEIVRAMQMADNEMLYDWSHSFDKRVGTILFTDMQGMVLAGTPAEFRFGDIVADSVWFSKALREGGFVGLAEVGGVKSLVSARCVRKYDDVPVGVVCVAIPVTPAWLAGLIDDRQILRVEVAGETIASASPLPGVSPFQPLDIIAEGFADPGAFSLAFLPDAQHQQLVAVERMTLINGLLTAGIAIAVLGLLLGRQLRPYSQIVACLQAYSRDAMSLEHLREHLRRITPQRSNQLHGITVALIRMIDTIQLNFDRVGAYASQLEILANTDALTGLHNRKAISEILETVREHCEKERLPLSVLMLDIDCFKAINDTFGHQTGDAVLMAVATLLRHNSRKEDAVGRWGGEEFLIVSPHLDEDGARSLAERLRVAVRSWTFPQVSRVTISLGVSQARPGDSSNALIGRADAALYQAKEQGRNAVRHL